MSSSGQATAPWEVLVLGAGMAGLSAARHLAECGLRTLVLEARERMGGRLLSVPMPGGGVAELGAEFIHGRAPELWQLIAEAGVTPVEREGTMLRETAPGQLDADREDGRADDLFEPLEQLRHLSGPDRSFAQWVHERHLPASQAAAATGYVEGFNAADARRISARSLGIQQAAEDAIGGDEAWHVRGGYAQLTDFLARRVQQLGGAIALAQEARQVAWGPEGVEVRTAAGGVFRARRCVVTLPLGVLQVANRPGELAFRPTPKALAAAAHMAVGDAVRFTMSFRERWWAHSPGTGAMGFLFTPERLPPVWWTVRPEPEAAPSLTGWVGGPRAQSLHSRSETELGAAACVTLAEVFGRHPDELAAHLLATRSHDWMGDRLARGAYSYVPVGGLDASAQMAEPEAGTLFFAGEHTDLTGHWGTVHAALRSGLRVAAQVLAARR